MFKTVVTLLRGRSAEAAQDLADRNAITILDQQIRDAVLAFDQAKRALALAFAQDKAEANRIERLDATLGDIEERALAALQGGRRDLAEGAAATIAGLELERRDRTKLRERSAGDLARMQEAVAKAQRRLVALDSGRRKAHAMAAVQRLQASAAGLSGERGNALGEAEATLRRLEERSRESSAAEAAMESIETFPSPERTIGRLGDAGFGQRALPDASDVIARLEARLSQALPPPDQAVTTAGS